MEKRPKTLVETREDLMISSYGGRNPTRRTAHFLKPSINSIQEPIFDIPLHTLCFLPPTFHPKSWPLNVSFHGWRYPQRKWKEWVGKMVSLHEPTWRKAGIYEAILNSTYEIHRNNDLVFGVVERWCPETKSFIFPWGEATITLEDMLVAGYSVLGCPVFGSLNTEDLKGIEEKLNTARREIVKTKAKKACIHLWMDKFMGSGSEIEHEAFLALWLSRYIFSNTIDSIRKLVFSIAIHLARGTRIALGPAVLASIYRDLSLFKEKIVESTMLGTKKNDDGGDVLKLWLWSPFQLVQIWAWERFIEFQPKPNLIKSGEPRFARWDKLKNKVENVRFILDSAKASFHWRPYARTVKNWDFPKFFMEKGQWLQVESSLDEDLVAFALCVRVAELVGLDCMEQYLPHRVAMQFGIDQDLPGCVGESHKIPQAAWAAYRRLPDDVKVYVPPRLFEADVTARYKEWWKKSMVGLLSANKDTVQPQQSFNSIGIASKSFEKKKGNRFMSSFKITMKSSKAKMATNSLFRSKIAAKSCIGEKEGTGISSFRMTPKISATGYSFTSRFKTIPKSLNETRKDGDVASTNPYFAVKSSERLPKQKNYCSNASVALGNPLKQPRVSAKSSEGKKERNNLFASRGFRYKSLNELSGSPKQKTARKFSTFSHVSPFKISKKLVPSSVGKNKSLFEECASESLVTSWKGKNEENKPASPACPPSSVGKNTSVFKGSASESLAPSLKRKNEVNKPASPARPSKPRKTIPLSFTDVVKINNCLKQSQISAMGSEGKKERDNMFASHGFHRKSSAELAVTGSSKQKTERKGFKFSQGSPLKIKISVPSLAGKKRSVDMDCTSESLAPSLKRKNEDNKSASLACPSKTRRMLPLSFTDVMDINNCPVPPGFPPKSTKAVAGDSILQNNVFIAETPESVGRHEGFENRQDGDVENSSSQSRSYLPTVRGYKVVEFEDVEIQQNGGGEMSSGQLGNHSSPIANNEALESSSGQSGSHFSSTGDNVGGKNLEPVKALVEKVKCSKVATVGSERFVEDANQGTSSLTCQNRSINDTREGSSYKAEMQWVELQNHVEELDQMIKRMKSERLRLKLST